jgi:membrane-bound lytic murein transglycosylase D
VSATEIAFVNQLGETTDLAGVESLIVPVPAVASSSAARSTRYVAKKGDTLVTLADRFNVSVDDLRSWNRLKGTTIAPGHSLYVSEPARVASPRSRHAALKASSSHARTTASAKSAQASTGHAAAHASSASKPRKKHSTVP